LRGLRRVENRTGGWRGGAGGAGEGLRAGNLHAMKKSAVVQRAGRRVAGWQRWYVLVGSGERGEGSGERGGGIL